MLGLFAATGHNNYAKSARLYVQQMSNLSHTHPQLYEQFMNDHHTIRRSDRLWSRLSPDMVIEQTMMRPLKSRSGLTRCRGMHETVWHTWLNTMTDHASIRGRCRWLLVHKEPLQSMLKLCNIEWLVTTKTCSRLSNMCSHIAFKIFGCRTFDQPIVRSSC